MRIVITGIGVVSAIGDGKEATLRSLLDERSGIAAPVWLPTPHREIPVGEVKHSNGELMAMLGIEQGVAISRTSLLGIMAAREAVSDARVSEPERLFFVDGTTVGGMDYTERHWAEKEKYADRIVSVHSAGSSTGRIADHVARFAGQTTVSTACSSALNAVITACNMLRSGECTQVLAGGAESLSAFHFNGFRALQILSAEPCRPFSADRQGLNLGEGAAYLVLETEECAIARKVPIWAYVAGYGNACDAFHQTASSGNGEGAFLAMGKALEMADIAPRQVGYINAHGTATPNNDESETAAMLRLFGDDVPAFSSTKAFTGHATSAAGGIELAVCLLAMRHGFVPAGLNWNVPMDNGLKPVLHTRKQKSDYVLCNSFGFGGNDSSLLLAAQPADLPDRPLREGVRRLADVELHETADYKQYIGSLQARRLTPALRQLVVTAYKALEEAGISVPDAVITATDLGCISNSVVLLDQLTQEGEDALKPTPFMQSTHNTPSSLVAIQLHCHGYNCTYSHGGDSFSHALSDAERQIKLGLVDNALVLAFDEDEPAWRSLATLAGQPYHTAIRAVVLGKE